jgi:hypothetical protein
MLMSASIFQFNLQFAFDPVVFPRLAVKEEQVTIQVSRFEIEQMHERRATPAEVRVRPWIEPPLGQ